MESHDVIVAPAEFDAAAHSRRLDVLGYTIVPGFLSSGEAAALRNAVVALHAAAKQSEHQPLPPAGLEDVLPNLQNHDRMFIDILGDHRLEALLMPRLNDPYYRGIPADAPNYILGELIARSSSRALPLHLDSWMPASGGHTWMMQVVVALEDREVGEGCTVVVPGSHRMGSYPDRELTSVVPLPAKTGDLILWDSRLWHAALDRTSERAGWVIVATLQRWWVKPRFDIPRAVPEAIYGFLSDRQKALLGYCSVPPVDEIVGTGPKQGYDAAERNRAELFRRDRPVA